ncbi:hypothetical protein [Paracoccus laeviglucosivorans]|uniref:Outer membrane protein n=1 Tax=Paracoccus laeviglucosivorans TaxID=1197861 RepID=A0A521EHF8_9RHOB|nr:hypothetical protein [Paracoccus laeviglucosivorans]SMO83346.1 hypothetical protein SAMN06265221_11363 [Paracoccus laeviglucosivorans]
MKTMTLSVLGLVFAQAAHGQALSTQTEGSDWVVQVSPYLWATGIEGRVSPFRRGPTIGVEKDFSDVMEELELGGFLNVWARRDKLVFSGDLMFVNTNDSKAGRLPALPGVPPGLPVSGDVDTKEFMLTLQGGYRFYDTPGLTLDGLAGARYWHVSNELTVKALGQSRTFKESFSWFDPLVGLRAFAPINDRWSVQGQADIGGFGVGSDMTWSVLATVNYVVTDSASISVGYRVLDVDYEDDGHVFDTRMQGPVIGATWRF